MVAHVPIAATANCKQHFGQSRKQSASCFILDPTTPSREFQMIEIKFFPRYLDTYDVHILLSLSHFFLEGAWPVSLPKCSL